MEISGRDEGDILIMLDFLLFMLCFEFYFVWIESMIFSKSEFVIEFEF